MRYVVLACDYDGTLASDGVVAPSTVAALEALRASGRKLILVTGRELADLQGAFARVDLFDRVVAENGALLYRPAEDRQVQLAPPPSEAFVQALRSRRVEPLGGAVNLGSERQPPTPDEVMHVLARPDQSAVVSLLSLSGPDRPLPAVRAAIEERYAPPSE